MFGRGAPASCHRGPGGHLAEPLGRAHNTDEGAQRFRRLRLRSGSIGTCDGAVAARAARGWRRGGDGGGGVFGHGWLVRWKVPQAESMSPFCVNAKGASGLRQL